jgi:hypothetical protein
MHSTFIARRRRCAEPRSQHPANGPADAPATIPHIIHQSWKTADVPERFHDWVVRTGCIDEPDADIVNAARGMLLHTWCYAFHTFKWALS